MATPRSGPTGVAVIGYATFLLIGWTGLLVPSLIRSIEGEFGQTDAGMGFYYFIGATFYASGSLLGGMLTERFGRRIVLSTAGLSLAAGLVVLATAPTWPIFVLGAIPTGLGNGSLDGGVNGLFLDRFREGRGRALNLLHLFFGIGALIAPLAVGRLVETGVAWPQILLVTAVAALVVGGGYRHVTMPDGRHGDRGGSDPASPDAAGPSGVSAIRGSDGRLARPIILLAAAIALYVASEIGVSNWLVRFLDPAPLTVATTALTLYWAGMALGRLISARFSDRFDHRRFAIVAALATAVALAGAILVPSLPAQMALFALTGFVTAPIYPLIMVVAGDRYPDRSAAVGGILGSAAVAGSVIYPPIMGFLSVTVGLSVAMFGNVLIALGSAIALLVLRGVSSAPQKVASND